jgi:predicted NBD/HSP70 family sugar kinase
MSVPTVQLSGLPLPPPKVAPELDAAFRPAALAHRAFREAARRKPVAVALALERADGSVSRFDTAVCAPELPEVAGNFAIVERLAKFLLWSRGGAKIHFAGPEDIGRRLQRHFIDTPTGRFDADIMGRRIYERPFEVARVAADRVPAARESTAPLGRHWNGCRIGFDLGASDRKVAADQEGKVVYSDEFPWDPRAQSNPQWHYDQIHDTLQRAAAHLPRVDGIGGSSAGVCVNNRVMVASLFRGVPEDQFEKRVKNLFLELQRAWGGVPFEVVNDGEVTALAGSMSLRANGVLGVALGSSQAAGFVTPDGGITAWLNELAFAPVDYHPDAPADEWSGDRGCGVQYFSQQCVGRLLAPAGLDVDARLPLPEKLVAVQEAMARGDERAARLYRTIGVYLGYAAAHYATFYDCRHLLVLGRVTTGAGGALILEQARRVLREEFPELAGRLDFHMPDEKEKRHGQAMAAASLPVVQEREK